VDRTAGYVPACDLADERVRMVYLRALERVNDVLALVN
jgi:hypothetical protein